MRIKRHLNTQPHFLSAAILVLFLTTAYFLVLQLTAQIHYAVAIKHIEDASFGTAIHHLEKALSMQTNDDGIHRELGRAYHALGKAAPFAEADELSQRAAAAFSSASRLNPLDAEAVFGLARETAILERRHGRLNPGQGSGPYDARPFFQETIRLRPNGILYHYAFARYLDRNGEIGMFLQVIENLARIYPLSYDDLKKEKFWSADARAAVKRGLRTAIDEGTDPRNNQRVLSSILAEEMDWDGAATHFKKFLSNQPDGGTSEELIYLGGLQLEGKHPAAAEHSFLIALERSPVRHDDLNALYRRYQRKGLLDGFARLFRRAGSHIDLSIQEEILMARSLFDQQQYPEARQVLNNLIEKDPSAEAYYWLALTAEMLQDWDEMELSIQKATVLDSDNRQYHLIFSRVLKRLNKLERSKREAGLASQHDKTTGDQ